MEKFKSTLRLKTDRLFGENAVPYSENTTYLDIEKNMLYKDFNGQRFAVAEVLKVDDLNLNKYTSNQKRILNSIIISKNTLDNTFETYYVKEDGAVIQLTSGGIAQGNVQSDWTEADTTVDSYIQNKPEEINLVDIPYIQNLDSSVSENETNINTHTNQIEALNDELDTFNGEIADINSTLLTKSDKDHTHESNDITDAVNIDVVPLTTLSGNLPINRIEGLLPVSKGGTGRNTLTKDEVLVGDDTAEIKTVPTIQIPSWAMEANKPSYDLDQISDGTNYKRVTQDEKNTWNGKQDKLTLNSGQVLGRTSSGNGSPEAVDTININQIKVSDLDESDLYALKDDIPTVKTYSGSDSIKLNGTSFERAALTGDITSLQNSNETAIANKAVKFAKIQDIATGKVLGRTTSEPGVIEEIDTININQIKVSDLDESDLYAKTADLPTDSDSIILNGNSFQRAALTGHVTASANSNETTIADNAVTFDKMQNIATGKVLGRITSGPGAIEELDLININDLDLGTGTVTKVKLGDTNYDPVNGVINLPAYPTSTTIADNAVTFAKMQKIATGKVLGRITSGPGEVEELDLIDIGEITPSSWTQVWSGSIDLNSYKSSFYSAGVPYSSYIGKRIAIEVQYSSYTSKIIFGVLGNNSETDSSSYISRGIGWSYFDGTNLRVKTLYAYTSTANTTRIYVGNLKTLFGKFSDTTIEWSTSYSEPLYMRKIWVIG